MMKNILILGGTRFFGIHTVKALLNKGHAVTIATRGITQDEFGGAISRLIIDRTDEESMKNALSGKHFDVVIDKIAYCSNDIKYALDVVDCDKYIYMSSTSIYEPKHWDTREENFDAIGKDFVWCSRNDFPYAEMKRQAEYALFQHYKDKKFISVRYPFTIGPDDYTQRLNFYVKHVINQRCLALFNNGIRESYNAKNIFIANIGITDMFRLWKQTSKFTFV